SGRGGVVAVAGNVEERIGSPIDSTSIKGPVADEAIGYGAGVGMRNIGSCRDGRAAGFRLGLILCCTRGHRLFPEKPIVDNVVGPLGTYESIIRCSHRLPEGRVGFCRFQLAIEIEGGEA